MDDMDGMDGTDGITGSLQRSSACSPSPAEIWPGASCEAAVHAEMRRMRVLRPAGSCGAADRRRYMTLWLALALRRSPLCRAWLTGDLVEATRQWRLAHQLVQQEHARIAVDSAFGPDDAPMEDAAASPIAT